MDMENPIKLETPTKEAFQLDTPSVGNGNGVVDADNDQANNNDASNNNDDFNGGNNENGNGPNSNADYSHNNEDENDCSQVNEDNNENGESSSKCFFVVYIRTYYLLGTSDRDINISIVIYNTWKYLAFF